MIKRLAAVMAAVTLMFTGCLDSTGKKSEFSSKKIVSYDYKYKIETPTDWTVPKEKNSMNKEATIEAYCADREIYFCSIAEETGSQDLLPFDNYTVMVLRNLGKLYNLVLSPDDLEDTTINDNKGKYIEIPDVILENGDETISVYLYYYLIDTEDYYAQMIFWTPSGKEEENRAEITAVMNSYSEFTTQT